MTPVEVFGLPVQSFFLLYFFSCLRGARGEYISGEAGPQVKLQTEKEIPLYFSKPLFKQKVSKEK